MTEDTRAKALAAFERRCPGVVGNKYVPHWPHPKQAVALGAHLDHDYKRDPVFELLFGGSAGGGKSDFLLQAAGQMAGRYGHFRGLLLRRTHKELMKAGALMSRAMQWWLGLDVHWDGSNKTMRFPNGATVEFGYHSHPTDNNIYQGGEWHYIGFDELTHWPDDSAFQWLRSRLRKNAGDPIPLRLLAASNPGQEGHAWVKKRFVGGLDVTGKRIRPVSLYLPSRIDDNPSLEREAYKLNLSHLHPTRRRQLLDGDWDARDPGDYFRVEWFGPMLAPGAVPPDDALRVRWWDLAASEAEDAKRTAGVLMARMRSGVRVVEHATAFKATPGKRDAKIAQQAHIDGRGVIVGLEIEGGSGGPAQFEALSKRLHDEGFRVVGARPKAELDDAEAKSLVRAQVSVKGKEGRADPVASCLERGHQRRGECPDSGEPWWGLDAGKGLGDQRDGLRLVAGAWTQDYLDEIESFPKATLCDLVDATTGAWAWLEAHPFGLSSPIVEAKTIAQAVELANMHPDDRPERRGDRDRAGRWRP